MTWQGSQHPHVHRPPSSVAVQARPTGGVQLQYLEEPGPLTGRDHHLQRPTRIGQHQSRRVDLEQLYAVPDEAVQQVDHVIAIDQGAGQLNESRATSAVRSAPGRSIPTASQCPRCGHAAGWSTTTTPHEPIPDPRSPIRVRQPWSPW